MVTLYVDFNIERLISPSLIQAYKPLKNNINKEIFNILKISLSISFIIYFPCFDFFQTFYQEFFGFLQQ